MNMKYFICIAFLFIFYSCTKDEFTPHEWGPKPVLEITPLAVILTPSNPVDTVSIETNYDYFSIFEPSWVSVSKIEEKPAIVVSAKNLIKNDFREGYVTIKIKRGKQELSRDFVVLQFMDNVYE